MKITFFSDVHFEFGTTEETPSGEVLVVAGDFTTKINSLHIDWLNRLDFSDVVYVLGNHEFYRGSMERVYEQTREQLAPHVHLLQDSTVTIQGQRFLGATLWTDYQDSSPLSMLMAEQGMNDHRLIRREDYAYRFRPVDALNMHKASVKYLRNNLQPGDIVVTHHAPSFQSVHPTYKDSRYNGCYCSSLEWLMEEKQPKLWFHGHVHSCQDYTVGNTRVLCNPRGYVGHENVEGFDWHKSVVI